MRTRHLIRLASAMAASWALAAGAHAADPGPQAPAGHPVLDARVRYLLAHPAELARGGPARIPISVRFAVPPGGAELAALERAGGGLVPAPGAPATHAARSVRLRAPDGRPVLGGRTVVPVAAAPADIAGIAALPGVLRVETAWSPQPRQAPLHQTRAQVGAEAVWSLRDAQDRAVLGTGVRIADLDSGVDVFHPDFWRDDGATHAWVDVDASGTLTDGDAVDLDGNGLAGADERVRWLDAPGSAPGQAGVRNPAVDHVYRDVNHDNVRNFGAAFGESAATFGEPVYRPRDLDGSGVITPGEPLVALGTSKIEAVYQRDDQVRRRGIDLIQSEIDTYSHGTYVASILLGGEPGRRFAGIAPGASLLMADLGYGPDPPFVSPFEVRMAWAAAEGADVMLYEDGEWIWLFLDGSSNVEQLVNEYAESGIVQVGAAGNLASGQMHWQGGLGPDVGDSTIATLRVAAGSGVTRAWAQLYWVPRAGDEVALELRAPGGERFAIGGAGSTTALPQYDVWHAGDTSPRGTRRVDLGLAVSAGSTLGHVEGDWQLIARRTGAPAATALTLHAMSWDELSGWSGTSTWTQPSIASTVTWPATADSMIVAAAYEPTGGALNGFSGRGPRVDGREAVDVTAPGSTTYAGRRSQSSGGIAGGYGAFGGTSAALPHVAGSVALLRQWLPAAGHGEIRALLRASARTDAMTGAVPNSSWGHGKLDVYAAAVRAVAEAPGPDAREPGLSLAAAPNPSRASTAIRFVLAKGGDAQATVFDVAGRVVWRATRRGLPAGANVVRWEGTDLAGTPVAAGVYLARVTTGGRGAALRVIRVR